MIVVVAQSNSMAKATGKAKAKAKAKAKVTAKVTGKAKAKDTATVKAMINIKRRDDLAKPKRQHRAIQTKLPHSCLKRPDPDNKAAT